MTYSYEMRPAQGLDAQHLDTANILDDVTLDARIIPSPDYERRSTSAWHAKLNAAPDAATIYRGIIREWLTYCYDADHAVFSLRLCGLISEPYTGDPYDLMADAAFAEFGPVALPEPVSGHIQQGYANPDLVAALAPVRKAGA